MPAVSFVSRDLLRLNATWQGRLSLRKYYHNIFQSRGRFSALLPIVLSHIDNTFYFESVKNMLPLVTIYYLL